MTLLRRVPFVLVVLLAAACTDPAPTTGSLVLSIDGLPGGATASVYVSGPNNFAKLVENTTTLERLEPGAYVVRANAATYSNATYAATSGAATITITKGKTESATIHYALASGAIDLTVVGLPTGVLPNIRLAGPYGFQRSILQGGVVGALPAGTYAIRADTISTSEGDRFGAWTFVQNVDVPASLTPVPVAVGYGPASGTLTVTVDGVPSSLGPGVAITGPGGFERHTAVTATYHGLLPGTYTITASKMYAVCPNVYVASQSQQTVSVTIGSIASRGVSYALTQDDPANLNLKVDAMTLTQVTQNYAGTVPLIAGRPALLRVFGLANQCNAVHPAIRVTVGGSSFDLTASDTAVATTPSEARLAGSWNYLIPGNLIQPGLSVSAVIDPTNAVPETNETDNTLTKSVDVRTMPATKLWLVPVAITAGGTTNTGNVSAANMDQFLALARKIHPISSYIVGLKPTFTSAVNTSQLKSNTTDEWGRVLSEIRSMSFTDSAGGDYSYHYGVVKVTYTSGIAGIGYIGAPAAIGWDYLPTGATVLAHELGHNFGRLHTPCGNPSGIDPAYPTSGLYANGMVGTYGYDPVDSTFKDAATYSDVMGYCNSVWISDYTYAGMLNWMLAHTTAQQSVSAAVQPSMLVWGRIVNGQPVLEPAFEISARPQLPAAGPNRITALDDQGAELFSIPFAADRIADLPGDQESFAFVVPRSMLRGRALAALRLTAHGRATTNLQAGDVGAEPDVTLSRVDGRSVRLRWDAARYPVILVRDENGNVLSFARGGDATIVTGKSRLELNYSNRVRSSRRLLTVK